MSNLANRTSELLPILETFMHNRSYTLQEIDSKSLEELLKLSQKHKVSSVVYEQLRTNTVIQNPEFKAIMDFWKRNAVRDVVLQVQRAEGFLDIYIKMLEAGFTPLVVKGIICRNLYSKSDHRISGDEDILLPRKQFEMCDEMLLKEGFQREELDMKALPYEISYVNPKNGVYIELHLSLFPQESGAYGYLNDEFRRVHEHKICEEIQGKRVYTLCPTDHLFYLICHSFKHFLHSGFGIRQVADMIMMAEHYGSQIDWEMIEEKLVRLSMKKYWDALVRIGVEYLGFSLEKAVYPKSMYDEYVDFEPLLMDLLDSGVYGDSSLERKHSSNMTLTAAAKEKTNTIASIGASLFPDKSYMMRSFAWLEKYPWLLPIAYLIRIVGYLKNREKSNDNGKNSVQIGVERVELLRKYEIIE